MICPSKPKGHTHTLAGKMEGFLKHTALPGRAGDNGRYKHVQHTLEAAKLSVQKSMDCVSMLHSVGMSGSR